MFNLLTAYIQSIDQIIINQIQNQDMQQRQTKSLGNQECQWLWSYEEQV